MADATTSRKTPQAPAVPALTKRELALQAINDYRKELAERYAADLKDWKVRRQAEIERIRTKLGRPGWHPATKFALEHVGPPPLNPLALPFWSFKLP